MKSPDQHAAHAYLIRLLADIAKTVVRYQDRESGLWFEVIDQPAAPGNYLESSGTAMFVYALAKGVNQGYLDRRFPSTLYAATAVSSRDKVEKDPDGRWSLIDIVQSAGWGRLQCGHPDRHRRARAMPPRVVAMGQRSTISNSRA